MGTILAAAALAVVPLVGMTAASASIIGRDEGFGATRSIAESNAKANLLNDYYGCVSPYDYYSYGQESNGTWYAWVAANCTGLR